MKSDKVEMNKGLLEAWLGAVHENDLPVNIQTGKEFDCSRKRRFTLRNMVRPGFSQ